MSNTSVQRRWEAACPNCGAPVAFASAASTSATCSYCRATLLRDGQALSRIGQSAELFEDYSPLQLGVTGRHQGQAFTLVGRVQLRQSEASWNEWHALFDSGKSAWLAEDNGRFVLSFDSPGSSALPDPRRLSLDQSCTLLGTPWQVSAVVQATVVASQGELPAPAPTQAFTLVELRNAQGEVASLSAASPAPSLSVGREVALASLALQGLRESSQAQLGSQSLSCPSCGASLEPKLATSLSISCGQCHAVVQLARDASGMASALRTHQQEACAQPLRMALGTTGQLAVHGGTPLPWQIVGYMERCNLPEDEDDEQSFWGEYLLYHREQGFAFLVDAEDGWSLVRPITGSPAKGDPANLEYENKRFSKRWTYTAMTTYVVGEFYWRVQRDERVLVSDYLYSAASRTELLTRELSGKEVVWSHGRRLSSAEVRTAFDLQDLPQRLMPSDVGSTQNPYSTAEWIKGLLWFGLLAVMIVLLFKGCSSDDCEDTRRTFGADSAEALQCERNGGQSSAYRGGSYGGWGSGGGGHK
ncbi:DUF4178 domain-containing protein [Roseateles sp. BYS180W]|uniref:DUF4178 domain-containing protein n=1 Tax=Roseateles rivi TaxID=3299028 RepID=A0ABW7FSU1_9BURK